MEILTKQELQQELEPIIKLLEHRPVDGLANYYSEKEIAAKWGFTVKTIKGLLSNVPFTQFGRTRKYKSSDINQFINRNTKKT